MDPGFFMLIRLALFAAIVIYLLSQMLALMACSRENRLMEPVLVWLQLVPIFNVYWAFVCVRAVSKSIRNEFIGRELHASGSYGYPIGIAALVCSFAGFFFGIVSLAADIRPMITMSAWLTLAGLALMFTYWVMILKYRGLLVRDRMG